MLDIGARDQAHPRSCYEFGFMKSASIEVMLFGVNNLVSRLFATSTHQSDVLKCLIFHSGISMATMKPARQETPLERCTHDKSRTREITARQPRQ
jgi:hypothetical protein